MSISEQLGFDVQDPGQIIARAWPTWAELEPDLAQVPDPTALQAWVELDRLRACDRAWSAANRVLQGLARLAAEDGGDDREAGLVLAWLMLPAAIAVARQYQVCDPEIDVIVAGQLFIEVRTYRWQTRSGSVGKVIARDLRRHVARQLGLEQDLVAVDPTVLGSLPDTSADARANAEVELLGLLQEAEQGGVIDRRQRLIVEDVMDQAWDTQLASLRNRALGGLTAPEVTVPVASRWAVSHRTIRRQVGQATHAIAEALAAWEAA